MAWPLTAFDQVFFDRGDGAAAVAAIHLAIKERCEATLHPLRLTTYADVLTGLIWLEDPPSGYGKTHLRGLLETFYADISDLVAGEDHIRFTETTGRSTAWTMASLETDIAMGPFADLLTRSQNPQALTWLQECLNRLIYTKLKRTPVTDGEDFVFPDEYGTASVGSGYDGQDAWDELIATPAAQGFGDPLHVLVLKWRIAKSFGSGADASEFFSIAGIGMTGGALAGTVTEVDYVVGTLSTDYIGDEWYITIGSSASTNVGDGTGFSGGTYTIEGVDADFSVAGTETVTMALDTAKPATVPFDGVDSPVTGLGQITCTLSQIWLYADIAGELTDQA